MRVVLREVVIEGMEGVERRGKVELGAEDKRRTLSAELYAGEFTPVE